MGSSGEDPGGMVDRDLLRHERFLAVRGVAGVNGMSTSGGDEEFVVHFAAEDADLLFDKLERIAALEAQLAERKATDEKVFTELDSYAERCESQCGTISDLEARLAEQDAALAALRAAAEEAQAFLWGSAGGGPRYKSQLGDALHTALSAPALQRAAEELRLLRELEATDRACGDSSGVLAALRAFRERP